MNNIYLDKSEEAFDLLASLLKNTSNKESIYFEHLNEINKLIEVDLIEFSKKDSPPHSANLFIDLKYEFEKFIIFTEFSKLASKNIVGIGGAFSSGKSTFLNSFFGRKGLLPAEIDPTTSVPTYIINGKADKISAINKFNQNIALNENALNAITHDFTKKYKLSMSSLLKSIYIEIPQQEYENLVFLDTPGYSKPDSESYSAATDEKIARAQLNSCNYIIWVIDSENGTIKDSDLNFLSSINLEREIPKLFIINKAELKIGEIEDVVKEVKEALIQKTINFIDVIPYSREKNLFPIEKIKNNLNEWNKGKIEIQFAKNFKKFFMAFFKYFEQKKYEANKILMNLNPSIMSVGGDNADVYESLNYLKTETIKKINNIEENVKEFEALKYKFFKTVKEIGDKVGIPLPEPKDIDLLTDKIRLLTDILKEYKKAHKIKDSTYDHIIIETFDKENSELIAEVLKDYTFKKSSDIINIIKKTFEMENSSKIKNFLSM